MATFYAADECAHLPYSSSSLSLSLANRTALITGASSGIGRATAIKLARGGAHVMCAGTSQDALDETRHEIQQLDNGACCRTFAGDLTQLAACDALVDHTLEQFGSLDII